METRLVVTILASAIGGGVVGGAVTYLTVKKTFAERAQRDIDDVKRVYADRFDGKRVVSTHVAVDEEEAFSVLPTKDISIDELMRAKQFVADLGYAYPANKDREEDPKAKDPESYDVSIYDRQETPPDDAEEVESPLLIGYDLAGLIEAHKPHLISLQEFHETKDDWDKSSLVYYEGDDTLTEENDRPIDDIEYLIGERHLDFFGLRSGDPNQVYVRSPQVSTDYEITRNIGYYTEIVLNIPKDSDRVGTRRGMRDGDDG